MRGREQRQRQVDAVAVARQPATATQRQRARTKADAVNDAFSERFALRDLPYVARTSHGVVSLRQVRLSMGDGFAVVDVIADGPVVGGDPHFRVINPPQLVADPTGSIIGKDGRRMRRDPLAALAEVVALHGGAQAPKRRRGRA